MSAKSWDDILSARLTRRSLLAAGLGGSAVAFVGGVPAVHAASPRLGFISVPVSKADAVVVPPDYEWRILHAWGDPILPDAPAFKADASQSAEDQARQAGMGHDGMGFVPLPKGTSTSDHGLLVVNYEYTDDGLLHPDGLTPWTEAKARKSKNAHGLGVIEIKLENGAWTVVPDSSYARRITADSPIRLQGPAAGHAWMKTQADPEGRTALGTWNNCAGGLTPWGTYLACEENVAPYFVNNSGTIPRLQDRYGIPAEKESWGYRWHAFDPRFDAAQHPNEPNRAGWVVELDPYNPASPPVKRTALGRMAHEGATVVEAPDGRIVVYMGDDDFRSKFEHLYKFVSRKPWKGHPDVLDEGTLYAARFHEDGRGEWLELAPGKSGLGGDLAEILIDARTSADTAGATYLDRPEWIAVHPKTGEVYCTLTNNTARGTGKPFGAKAPLGPDKANPRSPNPMGHILRWREAGSDPAARGFEWDVFLLAGDPEHEDAKKRGSVPGVAFAAPDGLAFDARGVLWIQTDSSAENMASTDWARIGHNQMLAADPATGEVRRFLTAPVGAEVTGIQFTPDGRTLFVNIQHPGEPPKKFPARNDPAKPKAYSAWPDGEKGGRPRSATIAIRRKDGGVIGS